MPFLTLLPPRAAKISSGLLFWMPEMDLLGGQPELKGSATKVFACPVGSSLFYEKEVIYRSLITM